MTPQEINEKIAKWLGFKIFYNETWDTDHKNPMFIPSGKPKRTHMIDAVMVPDFQNDFSPCLKWAVPELRKKIYPDYLNIQFGYEPENISCVIQGNDCRETFGYGDTESQAFTDALEKLISEEK